MTIHRREGLGRAWHRLGLVEIASGQLSISDTAYFDDAAVVIDLPPGQYDVLVLPIALDGHTHIAGAQVRAQAIASSARGALLDRVDVEFGQIGVCDRRTMEAYLAGLELERPEYMEQLSRTVELTGSVSAGGVVVMQYFHPGFGSDKYPIYELWGADGRRVGVEIECEDFTQHLGG